MDAEAGVLIIHGIGLTKPTYADRFISDVKQRLTEKGIEENRCAFVPVHWEPIFADNQQMLNEYLVHIASIWQPLSRFGRRFVVHSLGDAASYHPTYDAIHDEIFRCIKRLETQLDGDKPIMVVAHSLGTVLISDYVYDRQKHEKNTLPDSRASNDFQKFKTLEEIVTFGANIPLFKMGYQERVGIEKPSENFKWINYFSPFDILGYPLMNYYTEPPSRVNIEDVKLISGGIFSAVNWTSHSSYWKNKKILDHICQKLASLIRS